MAPVAPVICIVPLNQAKEVAPAEVALRGGKGAVPHRVIGPAGLMVGAAGAAVAFWSVSGAAMFQISPAEVLLKLTALPAILNVADVPVAGAVQLNVHDVVPLTRAFGVLCVT